MKRRDAIKVVALAALATTYASAYDEKLIVNKKDIALKDPANPSDFEYKHLPDITLGDVDAKGFTLVNVSIGQKGIIHPSTDKHWIYEIVLYADDKKVASIDLEPSISRGYLGARVNLTGVKKLTAISKCNLHGNYTASKTL
jgi:desulfoferrodoxin (superoxide reductase-like protein)